MKKVSISTIAWLVMLILLFVGVLTAGPALAMSKVTGALDMHPLSQPVDNWFAQSSGSYRGIVVLKDHKAAMLLYHRGLKPKKATDHEDFVSASRLKFYRNGTNRWDVATQHVPGQVHIRTLSPTIEQWIAKRTGQFRAVLILKLDGTVDVFQPRAHQIHQAATYMMQVSQLARSTSPVANVSYHRLPDEAIVWGCICINGDEYYW
ncbi:MAG: hypothetical protein GKS05_03585 [Nitrospirales bacterium]|nr:hypothetical protein [Nitrospirales bacterium]